MTPKASIAWLLRPAAHLVRSLARLRRIWAFARLCAEIKGSVDPSVVILGVPEIQGTGNISLGKRLFLSPALHLETQLQGSIAIGDNVVISQGVHIVSHAEVVIGENTLIGEYTSIRDADHRFDTGAAIRNSGFKAMPIRIGENVWIGRGVSILRGVSIGDHAVVAANAVVKQDVPAYSVVAGVPARPIRERASV